MTRRDHTRSRWFIHACGPGASEAFARLRARGAVEARVGTGSWHMATQQLVESVGYRLSRRSLAYGMQLGPTHGPDAMAPG